MKVFFDILPLGAFFIGYRFGGLMMATGLLVGATVISLAATYFIWRRIAIMALISGALAGAFGVWALVAQDPVLIKIKPTVANLLFAAVLLGGLAFRKPMLKYLLESAFQLTEEGWRILSLRWGIFFLVLAALNEIVWRNFSEAFWVDFKVMGMLSLTFVFSLSQLPLVKRTMVEEGIKDDG